MKKIFPLLCIGIILFSVSCKKDSNKNEINPLVLLALMGNSTLTVTATYNGTAVTGVDPADGTGKIFVYLYRTLGTTTRDPVPAYKGSTTAAVTPGTAATITVNGIAAGNYYVLVFYDYAGGGNYDDNFHDHYVLYNGTTSGTAYTSGASQVAISGATTLDAGAFGDTNELGDGSVYMTTTTYTLTVPVTYTGTLSADASATKLMYVYLYNTLGTATRNPALPVKTAQSAAVVESGVQQSIAVTDVIPGNYYALVFYDSAKGTNTDSQGDPYVFFANTKYKANAQQIVVPAADTTIQAVSFGETDKLQASEAYLTTSDSATLTVTSTYSGNLPTTDIGTQKMYVYLYGVLGTGTRNQYLPIFTGVSASSITTVGGTATIDVTSIVPGSYYVLVFYDYRTSSSNPDNQQDRYALYNGVRYISTAGTLAITAGSNTLTLNVSNDSWRIQSQSLFMTP